MTRAQRILIPMLIAANFALSIAGFISGDAFSISGAFMCFTWTAVWTWFWWTCRRRDEAQQTYKRERERELIRAWAKLRLQDGMAREEECRSWSSPTGFSVGPKVPTNEREYRGKEKKP